jgi:hypothetical protein
VKQGCRSSTTAARVGVAPDADTESLRVDTWGGIGCGEGGLYFTDDVLKTKLARYLCGYGNERALDPNPSAEITGYAPLPPAFDARLAGILAAGALGARKDVRSALAHVRKVRRAIGKELRAPDGTVVFQAPPVPEDWRNAPAYGLPLLLTDEAVDAYGLQSEHWAKALGHEGFVSPGYDFGIQRYVPLHLDPQGPSPSGTGADFPHANARAARGLLIHAGNLVPREVNGQVEGPSAVVERLREAIARIVADPRSVFHRCVHGVSGSC